MLLEDYLLRRRFTDLLMRNGAIVHCCVFRSKEATRFGLKWPPNSEQSGHLFRSESDRFLAAAETGGRHVPK